MKTKFFLLLLVSFVAFGAKSQSSQEIVDYYNFKIDELVGKWQTVSSELDEEKTNPVYAKVFTSPILYKSVIKKAFGVETASDDSEALSIDEQRSEIIDALMLDLYKEAPGYVKMTEKELRNEKSVMGYKPEITGLNLKINRGVVPNDVVGGMKTTVVKPNYWKFSGRASLTFTQSFISENWYQGGEKNYYAMLATVDLDLNYDNKERISWVNHFDFDLGFATYELDEKLAVRTNTDKLRLESTFGYKLVNTLDVAVKFKAESQSLPYYNAETLVSACLSPLDANASIGLNYKPNLGNFQLHVFVAPLSAYNLRYVYHNDLRAAYGIEEGASFKQDYGTQVVVTIPTYKLTSFLDVYSRFEYYTDYHRAFFQFETKFNVAISKYFTASLMVNARFDDSVEVPYEKWNFWQLKELFTLGVAYAW